MAVVERNPFSVIPGGMAAQQPQIEESELEIEIEDPEGAEEIGLESIEVDPSVQAAQEDHYANLAEFLDDEELKEIGETITDAYEADKESRAEWESTFERGFDLLGLKLQETTEPFEGSCTAVSPLIIESAVKFQSKATIELFPAGGPVRTQIIGAVTPEREDQVNRVQNFMNYQLTEQMTEYFDEFEKMLFHLPLIGSAFKKMYYDPSIRRPCSEFVPVDQFYVSYHASDLQKAERYTHVISRSPVEMDRDIASGMYMDADLQEATAPDPNSFTSKIDSIMGIGPAENYDQQYTILEQHCHLDLPEPFGNPDEVALPYVVTVEEESRKVIAIRRNWSKEDPTQSKQTYFTHYKFVPGFGFYGLGLIHLLGNMTMSATSALRSLVDAGQFSNLPGGFKARGVRVVGGNDPIAPGEFREVEATGLDLQKSIVPLPYKEPSQTLYNMLNWLTTAGHFDGRVDVIPVSDPNIPSAAHRLSMAQMVLQLSSQAPQGMYNLEQVHLSILKAANIQNPERFFVPPQEPQPQDPVADIQSVVRGLPIKAFPQQDHEAHIAIKTAFIEDPTLGKTEMMAPAIPVLQANIQEHMVMKYQEELSGIMQKEVQQAGQNAEVSPEVLSQLSIDAAEKILQVNEAMGGDAGSLEQQNLKLESARLDLEQQKMQLGATKDAADLALQNRELDIKEMSINQDHRIRALKDAGELKAKVDNSVRTTNAKLAIENIKKLIKERELIQKKRETESRYNEGGPVKLARGGTEEERILDEFIGERGDIDPTRWVGILDALSKDDVAEVRPSDLHQPEETIEVSQETIQEEQPTQGPAMMPEGLETALDIIKRHEGFKDAPYYATKHEEEQDISTIGYGDTLSGKKSVTEEEATEDVIERLNGHNEVLDETVEVDLTRGQREALLSLIDNVGAGAFKRSKALGLLNEGDYEGAFTEFFDPDVGFTKQAGKQLAGLVNRRQTEAKSWLS